MGTYGNLDCDSRAVELELLVHQQNDGQYAAPELDSSDLRLWNLHEELLAKVARFAQFAAAEPS